MEQHYTTAGLVSGQVNNAERSSAPAHASEGGGALCRSAEVTPPCGNYGGGTYSQAVVDWLRVRLPDDEETWRGLADWLGEWEDRGFGWRGWYDKSAWVLDRGLVAWCTDPERAGVEGVLVDLPGKACAGLGADLVAFLGWAVARGGKVTRIDGALDDRRGLLTRERIEGAWERGEVVTRWQSYSFVSSDRRGVRGWTAYFGGRGSGSMVRVYDKAAEQGEAGPWVRCELEAKGDYAHALALEVLARGGVAISEQIAGKLRFVDPAAGDTNRRRWAVCVWWSEFLGGVERGGALVAGSVGSSVASMRRWIARQVAPTLAAVVAADGGAVDWLYEVLESGRGRWGPRHRAALAGV